MKKRFLLFLLLFISLFMIGCKTDNNNTDDNNDTNNDDNPTFILNYITATEKLVEIEVDSVYLVPVDYDGVGDYSDLTFEFDNEGIISIEEGEIIGLVPGIVNVKVVSKYNVEIFDTFTVFVNTKGFKKSSLRLSTPTNTLIVGNSFNVTVANLSSVNATSDNEFIYTVSDESILKIDGKKVTALKNGVANIMAVQINNPSNRGELTIYVGVQSDETTYNGEPESDPLVLYFADNNYTIDCATDEQLLIDKAKDYQRYIYIPDDENILIISDTGLCMGVKEGTVSISVRSKDTKESCTNKITVTVTGTRQRDYLTSFIDTALAEEGYREWTNNNDTKYGEWNLCNNQAWCATFVSWCANNAGVPKDIIIRSISVSVFMTTYKARNEFFYKEDYTPVKGDLIIFKELGTSHIGIVLSSDDTTVYTIEGNTSNMVAKRSYSLMDGTITGYCHPNYN